MKRRRRYTVATRAKATPTDANSTDEEIVARGLREVAACAVAVLGVVKLAEAGAVTAHPDKIGALLERTGKALLAATQGLAELHEIRGVAAADITPHRAGTGDDGAPHPLAGTLAAIRKARTEQPDR